MTAALVPAQVTPVELRAVLGAFSYALARLLRAVPGHDLVAMLAAQSALETGRWHKIWCYNFGNIRPGHDYDGLFCQFRCNEVIAGRVVWFDPPPLGDPNRDNPLHGSSFRAYESPEDGAGDYVGFLARRFPEAYAAAGKGDPDAFVHALKARGYFTADEEPYRRAVRSLFGEFRYKVEHGEPAIPYASTAVGWDELRRTVAAQQSTPWELFDGLRGGDHDDA